MIEDGMGHPLKCAVFTFIFGDYDTLKQPTIINRDWDHFVYTDQEPDTLVNPSTGLDPWQPLQPLLNLMGTPTADNRKKQAVAHMIEGHLQLGREYDITVSIGAQIQINCDLDEYLMRFRPDARLLLIRHPDRACLFDEAEACVLLAKDKAERVGKQRLRYTQAGHPPGWGLFATGVMAVNHRNPPRNERLHWWRDMFQDWWREVERGSCRDQIALPYVLRNYAPAEGFCEVGWGQMFNPPNPPFIIHPHK